MSWRDIGSTTGSVRVVNGLMGDWGRLFILDIEIHRFDLHFGSVLVHPCSYINATTIPV